LVWGVVGLTRKPIGLAEGTIAWSSSSRFPVKSVVKKVAPVMLVPGRLKLATRPSLTGSIPIANTIGIAETTVVWFEGPAKNEQVNETSRVILVLPSEITSAVSGSFSWTWRTNRSMAYLVLSTAQGFTWYAPV
jgi:hypothetical protein